MIERIAQRDVDRDPVLSLEHEHRYKWAARGAFGLVLDVACGTARLRRHLRQAPRVTGYIGLDNTLTALKESNSETATFPEYLAVAALSAVPLADGAIDTAISLETLEHVPEPRAAIAELRRVLRPGGVLIGSVPHLDKEEYETALYGPNPFHMHRLSEDELEAWLGAHFRHVRFGDAALEVVSTLDTRHDEEDARSSRLVDEADGGFRGGSLVFAASDDPAAVAAVMRGGIDHARGASYVKLVGSLHIQGQQRLDAADRLVVERFDYAVGLERDLAAARRAPPSLHLAGAPLTFVFGNHGGVQHALVEALHAATPRASLAAPGHPAYFDGAGLQSPDSLAAALKEAAGPTILDAPLDLWRMADYVSAFVGARTLVVLSPPQVTVHQLRNWVSEDAIHQSIGANLQRSTNLDGDFLKSVVPGWRQGFASDLLDLLKVAGTPEDIIAIYWYFAASQYRLQALSRYRDVALILFDGEGFRVADGSTGDAGCWTTLRPPMPSPEDCDLTWRHVNDQITAQCLELWNVIRVGAGRDDRLG